MPAEGTYTLIRWPGIPHIKIVYSHSNERREKLPCPHWIWAVFKQKK